MHGRLFSYYLLNDRVDEIERHNVKWIEMYEKSCSEAGPDDRNPYFECYSRLSIRNMRRRAVDWLDWNIESKILQSPA